MSCHDIYCSICELIGMPTPGRVPTCICAPRSHSRNRMEALKLLLAAAKTTLDLLDQLDAAEETRLQLLEAREAAAWEQAKAEAEQKEAEQKETEQKADEQKAAEQKAAEQKKITLSLYHQMQRVLILWPPNPQLYGCDYCLARTYTAYDRDEHLAVHLQFD
ncbi:hypothetical protein T492DRAFT_885904 [Pavlovales sp. CCMP2436]|nr:hypothetical protein T492DRAFT_885904 [Pavlovales sp. CCMP2436]